MSVVLLQEEDREFKIEQDRRKKEKREKMIRRNKARRMKREAEAKKLSASRPPAVPTRAPRAVNNWKWEDVTIFQVYRVFRDSCPNFEWLSKSNK